MVILFCLSILGLISYIDLNILWDLLNESGGYVKYSFVVLLIVLILFGYYYLVFLMRVYYGEECKVKWVIMGGIFIVLVFYLFWVISIFGVLLCENFVLILVSNGDLGVLL